MRSVFFEDRYSDKSIEFAFRNNRKWGARDRKFVAGTVFDIVRHWRRLWFELGGEPVSDSKVLMRLVGQYLSQNEWELPEWEEFEGLPVKRGIDQKDTALKESFPDWIHELGVKSYGERWPEIAQSLNKEAPVFIRVNTLKVDPDQLIKNLKVNSIEIEKTKFPTCLRIKGRRQIFKTDSFKNGHFEVQDISSQSVAAFSEVKPGDRVVDACAGAGGKTLHMSVQMRNKGKIISLDIHAHKLEELRKRARRNGVDIIEARPIESSKVIKRLNQSADVLLLDVPCTGSGVYRRNPDGKWKMDESNFQNLLATQKEILGQYSSIVKVGGRLVYSTCSIWPEENSEQIQWFLNEREDFDLVEEASILPNEDGGDGFYMAKLIRVPSQEKALSE